MRQVAIIGLGLMGGAIAKSLHDESWSVVGYDIDAERCHLAKCNGVDVRSSLEEAVGAADVVLTSLPTAKALAAVTQALSHAMPAKVVVEMSTLSVADKLRFQNASQKAGHHTLDCPLSGTGAQAARRELVVYASGDKHIVTRLLPLLRSFSRQVFHVGAFGNGTRMKLVANTLVAIHNVATAEAILLAKRSGLDLELAVECIAAGAGSSCIFAQRGPLMVRGAYDPPSMKLSVFEKDLDLIAEFARSCQSPTPLFSATLPIYRKAIALGYGDCDTAAVMPAVERSNA